MARDSIPYNIAERLDTLPGNVPAENVCYFQNGDSIALQAIVAKGDKYAESRYTGENLPYSLAKSDSIFIFFFICFILFARIYKESFIYLKENVALLFSLSNKRTNYKEITTKEAWFSHLLVLQSIVLIAISIYDSFMEYLPMESNPPPLLAIGSFIGLFLIFILIKFIWYKIFGYVFDLGKGTAYLMKTGMNIFEILGIIFFIPVLLLIYLEYWHLYIICFLLILFLISQIIYFIRIIVYFVKEKFSFLFLIAYLCTVEIIPYFFLAAGLVYLYKTDLFNVVIL